MPSQQHRNQALDVLRGIAILLVMGRHYEYPWLWNKVGWAGVDLFFVLSGFLISGLLFKEYRRSGAINLKLFWIRRGFKIYPAFYAFMVFVIVDYAVQGNLTKHIFSDLFFLQDYLPPIAEHGWSLGVEEKFYLVLPILLFVLIRRGKNTSDPFRPLPYLFLAILLGCLALRFHALSTANSWYDIERPAHLRMDGLFAGVTLRYYKEFRPDIFRRAGAFPLLWLLAPILLLPVVVLDLHSTFMVTLGLSTTLLGFAALVLLTLNLTLPQSRFFKPIAWVGKYSYSIYLWNFVIRTHFGHPNSGSRYLLLPVYIAFSLGVGWLMAYLVETPFLAIRDKKFPAHKGTMLSSLSQTPQH
jgi:peptidoglycan/LPS O-acetylase OafA/YrhL